MSAFYLIGFVQAAFFSIIIFTKKKFKLYDLFLAFFFLVMGLYLFFVYADESGLYMKHPMIILTDFLFWCLLGPTLFLYIEFVIYKEKRFQKKHLIHLLPAIITSLTFFDFIFLSDVKFLNEYKNDSILFKIGIYVWYYNTPLYYILAIIKLQQHKKNIRKYFSNTRVVDLKWLRFLTHGFAFFLLFLYGSGIVRMIFDITLPFNSYHYTWIVMVVYIFGLGFYGYKQKGIFSEFDEISQEEILKIKEAKPEESKQEISYKRSGLTDEESSKIMESLIRYMENDKPYLDFDLNLKNLADALETTTHKVSQVLNEKLQMNFFEFVNKYRVDEVKQSLADPGKANYKIISLAYDAGFNSKSSFYTIFKKHTSLTPAEYRAQHMQENIAV